jgi:hypothetical protein
VDQIPQKKLHLSEVTGRKALAGSLHPWIFVGSVDLDSQSVRAAGIVGESAG